MMHVVIFPTWDCQLSCDYCSIRHSKIDRRVRPAPVELWERSLRKALTPGSLVDVAGGEPLLYEGILELLSGIARIGHRWALTTNGKATGVVDRLCAERPRSCAAINVSDHAGNPEAPESVAKLRAAGYHVNTHRVDHPSAGKRLTDAVVIPYQSWKEGGACDGIKRHCTAGLRHWVADPQGNLWRCVVALETGQPSGGNLFTGEVSAGKMECTFGCSTCYTGDAASWFVEMREMG